MPYIRSQRKRENKGDITEEAWESKPIVLSVLDDSLDHRLFPGDIQPSIVVDGKSWSWVVDRHRRTYRCYRKTDEKQKCNSLSACFSTERAVLSQYYIFYQPISFLRHMIGAYGSPATVHNHNIVPRVTNVWNKVLQIEDFSFELSYFVKESEKGL